MSLESAPSGRNGNKTCPLQVTGTPSPMQDEEVIRKCRQFLSPPVNHDRPTSPVRDLINNFESTFFGFIIGQRKSSLQKNITTRRVRPTPVGKPQTAVPIKDIETPMSQLIQSPSKPTESPATPVESETSPNKQDVADLTPSKPDDANTTPAKPETAKSTDL